VVFLVVSVVVFLTHSSTTLTSVGKEGKQMGVPAEPQAFVGHIGALLEEVQVRSKG
jgi:hypothetical protein